MKQKIEWNKVTWYSKTIALAIFIIFPFCAFYFGMEIGQLMGNNTVAVSTSTSQNSGQSAYYSNPTEWQADTNNAGAFTILYPIDFDTQDFASPQATLDWRMNAGNTSGKKFFTLTIPKAFDPQSNLADATLTVASSANSDAVKQCLTADPSGGPNVAPSNAMINGISFTVFHTSDAGAGNIYQTTSYRTVHGGQCYAIEYTIHSSQIANYPASYNLHEFNSAKITSLLDGIVGTFKFK